MEKQVSGLYKYICCIAVVIAVIVLALSGRNVPSAFADTAYDVLDDFVGTDLDIGKYPVVRDNYELELIQLAEGKDKRVYLYVYHPNADPNKHPATRASISVGEFSVQFRIYELELMMYTSTIAKYVVKDLTVNSSPVRYYGISELYRAFDEQIDDPTNDGTTIDQVYCNVSKEYTVTTLGDTVSYTCKAMETLVFTDMYCGFVRYSNGWLTYSKCDSHFLAFSTDRQIDKLLSAEVYYEPVKYMYSSTYEFNFWNVITGKDCTDVASVEENLGPQYVNVLSTQHVSYKGKGWFAQRYDFDRIETVEDFIVNEDLKDGSADRIKDMQWVLRFCETDYEFFTYANPTGTYSTTSASGTKITNATVLALTFETNGRVYNVGVVANVMTENPAPGNTNTNEFNFNIFDPDVTPWWVWLIVAAVAVVAIIVLLAVFVPTVLPAIFRGLLWLLKGLWWLICLPFKGIAALVRKIKENKK